MDWEAVGNYLLDLGKAIGIRFAAALIVFVIGHKLIKYLRKWIAKTHRLDKFDAGVRSFLGSFAKFALYIILFITLAIMVGIPATSFITALASCGVAVGLAMQGSLSNLAGGIMLLIFKPFKVGDYIKTVDAAGTVEEITVVYTILCTVDNKRVTVPNGTITNAVIENHTAKEIRRVDIDFNAGYDCDVEKVKSILMSVMENHPKVLKDPQPFARVSAHTDNSLTYTVRAWCKAESYWEVSFDLKETVKKEFDKNNIEIPLPKMDINILK